jgi:hypothetical protein
MLPNIDIQKEGMIMSQRSKREYREAVHLRYKNARRHEKTAILDEFCATCGCHRKHAIRVLKRFKRFTKPRAKKRGEPPVYHNEAIINPMKEIWLAANLPCSKRLQLKIPRRNDLEVFHALPYGILLYSFHFLLTEISPITCCNRYPLILLAAGMIIS